LKIWSWLWNSYFEKEWGFMSPDGNGILLFWGLEQKIQCTAGAKVLVKPILVLLKTKKAPVVQLMLS
jgi:hypothetical protein